MLLAALCLTAVLSLLLPWLLEGSIVGMTAVGIAIALWILLLSVAGMAQGED